MYPITAEARELFRNNNRQIAKIIVKKAGSSGFILTESNICQGGLTIDRYSLSRTNIEIGTAIAAELKLILDNKDNSLNIINFDGAELEVLIGTKKWDATSSETTHLIPMGFFTVDDTPRKLSRITLSALDRMVRFDQPITSGIFPVTIKELLNICCIQCNVPLSTNISSLPNSNYLVTFSPDDDNDITYRQLIQWIAEITGTCAYIDWNGQLRLEWYNTTDTNITSADRYTSDIYENDITITGVQITDNDTVYLAGTSDYAFNIAGNLLITHDCDTVAQALYNKLGGFTYRPYSCKMRPAPHLYPLDGITFTDKDGVAHKSVITHCTFKMNAAMSIAGKGESIKKATYAAVNPLNKQEAIIIEKLKKKINDDIAHTTQTFTVANGVLDSKITAEVERATEAETTLVSQILQTADKIAIIVNNDGNINIASIIAAINNSGDSEVQISADKINLTGVVKIEDLSEAGNVVVNGSRIHGGTLVLGGGYNGNGKVIILDEDGNSVVQLTNEGLRCYDTEGNMIGGMVVSDNGSRFTASQLAHPKNELSYKITVGEPNPTYPQNARILTGIYPGGGSVFVLEANGAESTSFDLYRGRFTFRTSNGSYIAFHEEGMVIKSVDGASLTLVAGNGQRLLISADGLRYFASEDTTGVPLDNADIAYPVGAVYICAPSNSEVLPTLPNISGTWSDAVTIELGGKTCVMYTRLT